MQTAAAKKMTDLESIKGAIAAKMDSATFSSWISPLQFDISDGTLHLIAQNQFSSDFVKNMHGGLLAAVAAEFNLKLNIAVGGANAPRAASVANDNATQVYTPETSQTKITKAEVGAFDSFISSDENALVLAACKKVASGAVAFSPLFIYGGAGCGKSMLAGCIHAASNGRTLMMTGGQFVSEFARSLRDNKIFAFKDFCRNCDTFILDDVQTLAGKRATCQEFLQLISDLRSAGKNIVLTANASPNNLTGFDRALQSVLASGLVADVMAPNANVRRVMLLRAGVAIDVADELAGRLAADGHMVGGVALKIKTYTELMGTAVNMEIANRLLADTLQRAKTPIAMVRTMCEKLGVSYDAICGRGRSRALVLARQMMMSVLKSATKLSLSEIGQMVGGRDHATVLYAIAQIEKNKKSDLVLSAQINQLIADCQ